MPEKRRQWPMTPEHQLMLAIGRALLEVLLGQKDGVIASDREAVAELVAAIERYEGPR